MGSKNDTALQLLPIISNNQISNTTAILRFRKTDIFIAGQVVSITTDPTIPPRIYSICSSELDKEIAVLYKIVEDGLLTPKLSQLKTGDQIYVSKPSGKFLATKNPAWFIATGTGIAPFISMILSGYEKDKVLIHGSRSQEDLYFNELMTDKLASNYYACCNSFINNSIYHGRVTQFISNRTNLPKDNKYYLCGKAEMVVEVRDILISKGILYNNILSEIYF